MMAVTPAGPKSAILDRMRTFLSGLAAVQAFLGVDSAEDALARIHLADLPGPGSEGARPFLIVDCPFEGGLQARVIATQGGVAYGGNVLLHGERYVEQVDGENDSEDLLRLYNQQGQMVKAILEGAHINGILLRSVSELNGGELMDTKRQEGTRDYWLFLYSFEWGVQ